MSGAEWMWLERWHGNSPVGPNVWAGWTPDDARSLQQVREKWQSVIRQLGIVPPSTDLLFYLMETRRG